MFLQLVVIALTTIFFIPGSDACSDLNRNCPSWASRGECQRNPGYMKIYCKKSCGLCPKQGKGCPGCWDNNPSCSSWASIGECRRNPAYMLKYCKFSCKVCTCSRPKPTTELPTPPPIPTTQRPVTRPTPPKPTTDWPSPPPPKPGTGIPPIPTKDLPSPPMPTTEGPMSPEPGTTAAPSIPPKPTTDLPSPPPPKPETGAPPVLTTVLPSPPMPTTGGPMPPEPGTTAPPVPPMPETTAGPVPPIPETTAKPVPPMPETTAGQPMPGTTSPPIPEGDEYDEVDYDNGDDEDDEDDNDDVCKSAVPVGIAVSTFPGEAFKASTSESQWHQPEEGRLNNQESDESVGAWCAGLRDNKQYIKVDLGEIKNITAIYSQGRESEYPKYVTKYSVDYSKDGTSWESYKDENDPSKDKVFEGNSDNTSIKMNKLKKFILTKHLRIRPVEWKNMICMRLEFEYCDDFN